jgi:hypothetical protein
VQGCSESTGTGIAKARPVTNFFMAGSDLVSWEIVTMGDEGPYRLSVIHPRGKIVEYFTTTAAAMTREQEIEAMFLSAATQPPTVCAS